MKKLFLTFIIFFLIATPIAAAYTLQVDYPAIPNVRPTTGLVDYIRYVYLFALGTVGLVAFGVMVYGGIIYMMSGTDIVSKSEAKNWFKAAISGLLLALASYLILNTINPNLVRIKAPTLPATEIPAPTGPSRTSTLRLGERCTPNVAPQCDAGLICQGGICIQGPTAPTLPAPSSSQYQWEKTDDCSKLGKTGYGDAYCSGTKPGPEYKCCKESIYSSTPTTPTPAPSTPSTENTYNCSALCISDTSIKTVISNSPDCASCESDALNGCEKNCGNDCIIDQSCIPNISPKVTP